MEKAPQQYWLVKSDFSDYSWANFVKDKITIWSGVRNYQARNYIGQMKPGDICLFYESGLKPSIAGLCKVEKQPEKDPTSNEQHWLAVQMVFVLEFNKRITLAEIKSNYDLSRMMLIKQPRLSVMPVTIDEFNKIIEISGSL